MKKLLFIASTILFITPAFSQHQTDNWFFGVLAGINFTIGAPVDFTGSGLNTTEGCSAMSNDSGNVLFYTDGVSVWNKNNQVMPNGTGLLGSTSSTQSALAVPIPSSATQYYIFTVDEIGNPNGFEYSIVDMTLDGGLGDVTSKNNVILNNVCEKLTFVQQGNTGNYWVAVHEWGTDAFYVYSLTPLGLQPPVISHSGRVHDGSNFQFTYGQMKFNTCGDMLGVAIGYIDTVEVFSFDNATGVVSNPFTLPMGAHVYGLEFSGDGKKLYVTTYDPLGTLVQLDLSVLNTDSILASKIALTTQEDMYGLQLGIDGKIYAVHAWSNLLGVVNSPNQLGFGCNFDLFGYDLDPSFNGVTSALGLPGFVTSFLQKGESCLPLSVNSIAKEETFSVYPNPLHAEAIIKLRNNSGSKNLRLKIYDTLSRMIREDNIASNSDYSFYRNGLPAGIYFLKIDDEEQGFPIQKLIIE